VNRIEVLRKYIDEILLHMEDSEERRNGYVHLYGVAQACALISMKRGQDAELATMTGILHDIYSYTNMDIEDHAQKGAVMAREILASLHITNADETEMICNAINTHSDKEAVHSDFNEVLKDADVFQQCLYNPTIEIQAPERKKRFEALKREFGIIL
jgi:HD superfamily phosphodiesterase